MCVKEFVLTVFRFFIMGYVLQFGEMAHQRVHHYVVCVSVCVSVHIKQISVNLLRVRFYFFWILINCEYQTNGFSFKANRQQVFSVSKG